MQYPTLGLLSEKLKKAQQFAANPFGYSNPPVDMLMNLLGVPAVQQTMERIAYGEPLTTGKGMTTQVRPEAVEAAMTLLPAAGTVGKAAERGAMAAGRAGERYAEKVVPQIMERGGMPASLLEAMATNTTSKMFVPATADEAYMASQMLKKKTPQEVWQEIGILKGPDGEFRKELSDKLSTVKGSGEFGKTIMGAYERGSKETGDQLYKTTVKDVLSHNELEKAYPELMSIETQMMPKDITARGSLLGTSEGQVLRVREDLPSNDARSTMLHELQHAIQEKEGFAAGGNVRDFAKMRDEANNKITELNDQMRSIVRVMDNPATTQQEKVLLRNQYEDLINERQSLVSAAQIDPNQAYGHLMGEAEARLTQRRMDLTPEERKKYFPFEYTGETGYGLDVYPENLIHMTPEGTILKRGLLGQ
jgi:hypothetical protein